MHYNHYSTQLKLSYKLGLLPHAVSRTIPGSTRHYWKGQSFKNLFGQEYAMFDDQQSLCDIQLLLKYRRLTSIARALVRIIECQQQLIDLKRLKSGQKLICKTIDYCKESLGLKRSVKVFNMSLANYYYWRSQITCHTSLFKKCFQRHPQQLTLSEVKIIAEVLAEECKSHWPLVSKYYNMLRNGKTYCSLATFYLYAKKLGYSKSVARYKKSKVGIRANRPYEVLHQDVTILRTLDGVKNYIYLLVDNYSRQIIHAHVSLVCSSNQCAQHLRIGLTKIKNDSDITLLTDDGVENKGEVSHLLESHHHIKHVIAQKDIPSSNSCVEAVNKIIKQKYLYQHIPMNHGELKLKIDAVCMDYNNRPHGSLQGLTPNEAANGIKPKNYGEYLIKSRARRMAFNKEYSCHYR